MKETYLIFLALVIPYTIMVWRSKRQEKEKMYPISEDLKTAIAINITNSQNFTELSATKLWLDKNEYLLSPNDYFSLCEQYKSKESIIEKRLSSENKESVGKIQ